jgi:hypothetical protein
MSGLSVTFIDRHCILMRPDLKDLDRLAHDAARYLTGGEPCGEMIMYVDGVPWSGAWGA